MSNYDDTNPEKEIPESRANGSGEGSTPKSNQQAKFTRRQTKIERMLRLFLAGGKYNFQTVREHGDSCLHSTISTFRHMYGIEFDDEPHVVRGYGGNATRCKQYWLRRTPENIRRVWAFLGIGDDEAAS
jgi:hypothetical protein